MIQYFKNVWSGLSSTFLGMYITFKHLFVKKVTIQYPDQRFTLPDNARNRLKLEMERCNGCNSCVVACPVNCITLETVRVSPEDPHQEVHHNGNPRKMWVTRYEIDFAKCCYCGLCTQACPSDAIQHTQEYEYSSYKREDLYYKFQTLSPDQVAEKHRMYAELKAKDKPAKAEGATEEKKAKPEEKKEKEQ
ncbi:MAG: NADH dehydrogenase subunit I [Bacteroidetes bacterium]|nr:MAG: NADH dehydrogenase subunit I [Bacteroidota bacterium]